MRRVKPILVVLFVVYSLVMLWLLFGQRLDSDHSGIYREQLRSMPLPFQTIIQFGRIILTGEPAYLIGHAWQNLVGNVVMFIPIGFCLPLFSKRYHTAKRTFLTGVLIVACIELTQFFTLLGSLDFDDFLLNSLGIMLGFLLWKRIFSKIGD